MLLYAIFHDMMPLLRDDDFATAPPLRYDFRLLRHLPSITPLLMPLFCYYGDMPLLFRAALIAMLIAIYAACHYAAAIIIIFHALHDAPLF
jgi:hypothetical protein